MFSRIHTVPTLLAKHQLKPFTTLAAYDMMLGAHNMISTFRGHAQLRAVPQFTMIYYIGYVGNMQQSTTHWLLAATCVMMRHQPTEAVGANKLVQAVVGITMAAKATHDIQFAIVLHLTPFCLTARRTAPIGATGAATAWPDDNQLHPMLRTLQHTIHGSPAIPAFGVHYTNFDTNRWMDRCS